MNKVKIITDHRIDEFERVINEFLEKMSETDCVLTDIKFQTYATTFTAMIIYTDYSQFNDDDY